MDAEVLLLFTWKIYQCSLRFYWSLQGSVTSIHQAGRSVDTQMPHAALTVGNFCRAVQMPQNSKKSAKMWEIPCLLSGREKWKPGMVGSRPNLPSTIYVVQLIKVLSGVVQNGKWNSSLNTFLQFPFLMLPFTLSCLRSTRSFKNQKPSILRMFSYNSLKFNESVKTDKCEKCKNSKSPNSTNGSFLVLLFAYPPTQGACKGTEEFHMNIQLQVLFRKK